MGERAGDRCAAGRGTPLTLDLDSRLEGLAPASCGRSSPARRRSRAISSSTTNSSVALPGGLHLVSAAARLDFEGGRSADGLLDLKVHAGAISGSPTVGKMDLNASINGPLSNPTIDGAFDAGEIRVEQGSVDRVDASFHASPDGPLTEEKTRIAFEGDAKVNGLALADPAFAQAIGRELTLKMRGSASSRGEATFDVLDLFGAQFRRPIFRSARAAGKFMARRISSARDLSRFALIAGGALTGEARIAADLDGAPRYGALSATLDAARDETRDALPAARQGDRRNARPHGRGAAHGGRRIRLLGSSGERAHGSARLTGSTGATRWTSARASRFQRRRPSTRAFPARRRSPRR